MDFDKDTQATPDNATTELVIDTLLEGMQEVTVRVGPGGGRTQRFVGKLLSQAHRVTKDGSETIRVYQSRKGKLVVHSHIIDWNDFATATKHAAQEKREEFLLAKGNSDASDYSPIMNWAKGFKNWREMLGLDDDGYGDFTLEIVDSLGELRDRVPAKVYRIVADVVENPSTQVLDI